MKPTEMRSDDIPVSIRQGDEWSDSETMPLFERVAYVLVALCVAGFGLYALWFPLSHF